MEEYLRLAAWRKHQLLAQQDWYAWREGPWTTATLLDVSASNGQGPAALGGVWVRRLLRLFATTDAHRA